MNSRDKRDMPIEKLNLKARFYNALKRRGISNVSDILDLSHDELKNIKSIGKIGIENIVTQLSKFGYNLDMPNSNYDKSLRIEFELSCRHCVHYEACHRRGKEIPAESCRTFKNKDDIIGIQTAAELASRLYDNPCNSCYAEEYLPYVCDYKDNCNCSNVECWKQYFKHFKEEN